MLSWLFFRFVFGFFFSLRTRSLALLAWNVLSAGQKFMSSLLLQPPSVGISGRNHHANAWYLTVLSLSKEAKVSSEVKSIPIAVSPP